MLTIRRAYIIVAVITLGISAVLTWQLISEHQRIGESALQRADREAARSTEAIVAAMDKLEQRSHDLADRLNAGELRLKEIPQTLIDTLDDKDFFGAGIAYEKGVLGDDLPPSERAWYAFRQADGITLMPKDYEYTDRSVTNNAWFFRAVDDRAGYWKEPKFGRTSHAFITGYSAPFFKDQELQTVAGVVTINYSLEELHSLVREAAIWDSGYAMVYSRDGELIYHPDQQLVKRGLISPNADETTRQAYPMLCRLAKHSNKKSHGFDITKDSKGNTVWTMQRAIGDTGWRLTFVFHRDELVFDSIYARQIKRWLIIIGILASITSLMAVGYHPGLSERRLWVMSAWTATAFVIGIIIIWSNNLDARASSRTGIEKIKNHEQIAAIKDRWHQHSESLHLQEPVFVPTGTFIRSINFTSANDVVVNGYMWQRYQLSDFEPSEHTTHLGTDIIAPRLKEKGLVFVEAFESDIDLVESEKQYSQIANGTETIVWYFKVTLRQKFSYSQFPFDHEAVWLRTRYVDAERNVVLIPDLDAFSLVHEAASPGIDADDFILPGWELEGSYFNVEDNTSSSIGLRGAAALGATAELYYNVGIQRNFLDPFISNITPVMIIFLILFVIVLTSTAEPERAGRFGFNAFAAFGLVAALLFSTMYLHSSLRGNLASSSITYFECFYILGYVVMILVAINAIATASTTHIGWVNDRNNLIPKLMFWPLITASVFFVTVAKLQI